MHDPSISFIAIWWCSRYDVLWLQDGSGLHLLVTKLSIIDISVYEILQEVSDLDGDCVGVFWGADRGPGRHEPRQGPASIKKCQNFESYSDEFSTFFLRISGQQRDLLNHQNRCPNRWERNKILTATLNYPIGKPVSNTDEHGPLLRGGRPHQVIVDVVIAERFWLDW